MKQIPQIKINGEILKWARESLNIPIDIAAQKIKIEPDLLSQYESGEVQPSITHLHKMAEQYKRTLAIFLLPHAPKEPAQPKDFRTLPNSEKLLSTKVKLAIRRARRIQQLATELDGDFAHKSVFSRRIEISDNAEQVAENFRRKISVSLDEQIKWKDNSEAFRFWRELVEGLNIFVLQEPMPLQEVRGFSMADKFPYVIMLNSKDGTNGKIFTLFHEYAHLLLNQSGICDLKEDKVEVFCNYFAGAFLVPRDSLVNNQLVRNSYQHEWDENTLLLLADEYKVSQEVILRRLLICGLTSESFYKQKREEWSKLSNKSFGRSLYAKRIINQNGIAFTSLVFEGFNHGKITFSDAADYLGVKAKHLSIMERLLATT